MKIGRNSKCHCGSGKKYKKCCLMKQVSEKSIESVIQEASLLSLEHDSEKKETSLKKLNKLGGSHKLPKDQEINLKLSLVTSHQQLGEHVKAIEILESLESEYDGKSDLSLWILHMLAVSYGCLGMSDESCEMFDALIKNSLDISQLNKDQRRVRGVQLIEAGKSYSSNNQITKAKKCLGESISLLEEFSDSEIEHLNRAKANLLIISLKSDDVREQKKAVDGLEESIVQKLKVGDLQGVATNYSNLGMYFKEEKRYARAIAYYRKDLCLSRTVGNKKDLAATLGNTAMLYAELKQYTKGRELLREAKEIAKALDDTFLLKFTEKQFNILNKLARESGLNKEKIGDKAECLCESSKLYIDCCGQADFEPFSLTGLYGGISEDLEAIHARSKKKGKLVSPLDFILRFSEEAESRKSWVQMEGRDGYVTMKELPDMANIHLISAKEILKNSKDNDMSSSLSSLILCVCCLEAFINQVSFFIYDNKDHEEVSKLDIPRELIDNGAYLYQRTVPLEKKWFDLANCLVKDDTWLQSSALWNEVKDIIFIRNELVHFKTSGYEQVVPPPKKMESIYSKVPKSIKLNDVPHSWPMKLLNTELANWSIKTVESLITEFKNRYQLSE